MVSTKTTGLLLLGGATALYVIPKITGSEEAQTSFSGGSGGSTLFIPIAQESPLADVGTGTSESSTKKELSELQSQYETYKTDLLNTPISTSSSSFTTAENVTKKDQATALYQTTITTETTKTLGGKEITTQTKKQEKVPGTEWTVSAPQERSTISKIVNPYKNIIGNIANKFKFTGSLR